MEFQGITISFDDIFGRNPEDVTMGRLETFLEQIISDTFQRNEHNPNELVRIVDRGMVRWMTAEEAESYLQSSDNGERDAYLQRSIQQALRGDTRILEQEIKIIFLLANNTLKQYREKHLIPDAEILRSEPILIRLGRQIYFQLNQLRDIDNRVREIRLQNPILDEFERKMGDLLNFQKNGNYEAAAAVANELAGMKHRYVRISRGLKSDSDTAARFRLELQREKKIVLSTHRYLIAQREGVLQGEAQDLRENVENLKVLVRRSAEDRKADYEATLVDKSSQLVVKERELTIVQHEQRVIKKKEEETDIIINQMEQVVTPAIKEQPAETPTPKPAPETPPEEESSDEEKKARHRMAAVERRQQR